jgi:hypothetical protein
MVAENNWTAKMKDGDTVSAFHGIFVVDSNKIGVLFHLDSGSGSHRIHTTYFDRFTGARTDAFKTTAGFNTRSSLTYGKVHPSNNQKLYIVGGSTEYFVGKGFTSNYDTTRGFVLRKDLTDLTLDTE